MNKNTKLDDFVGNSSKITNNSILFDEVTKNIKSKCKENLISSRNYETYKEGKLREVKFKNIHIIEYRSNKQASQAFYKVIKLQVCCIPDKDIVKLKNFEDLKIFKNEASSTLLVENILIKFLYKKKESCFDILKILFKDKTYLKLDVGHGGPAIWTLNKI